MLHTEDPTAPKPYPPAPWRCCPRCQGNLLIAHVATDREEVPPLELWEIKCLMCAHELADWNRTLLTWRIREFRPPTVPTESSAPSGVKWIEDWRDLYPRRKDAA
jgi:hypothetical protein